jgi:uridylate kinase
MRDASAELIPRLSYQDVLKRELKVIDGAAISLCMESKIPVQIVNISRPDVLMRVVLGEPEGSWIGPEEAI